MEKSRKPKTPPQVKGRSAVISRLRGLSDPTTIPHVLKYVTRLKKSRGPSNVIRWAYSNSKERKELYKAGYLFKLNKTSPAYRAVNQNIPRIRKVLKLKYSEKGRWRLVEALLDSFYVRNSYHSPPSIGGDIIYMNRRLWRRYDLLLREANSFLKEQGKEPLM